ncbi:MAG: hypothetical protein HYZ39_04755 [Mycolicibacterium cosmeticum]|nr:hypothetical protein [Mycolicibacterium cosmeticum]
MTQDSRGAATSEWLNAGFSASDAQLFIDAAVPLDIALQWADAGIEASDAVDFIEKTVPLDEATEIRGRGIELWQITRSATGYEIELEPWQKDPLKQLPEAIHAGRFRVSIWSETPWNGEHLENVVSFEWDGESAVEWSVMSGSGLSMMSDVSFRGIAGWPDGTDLLVIFRDDNGGRQFERLAGAALTAASPVGATDPRQWLEFANSLIGITEQLLDSGIEPMDEYADEYRRCVDDQWFDFDEIFRTYLATANADGVIPDFDDWITAALAQGIYETS